MNTFSVNIFLLYFIHLINHCNGKSVPKKEKDDFVGMPVDAFSCDEETKVSLFIFMAYFSVKKSDYLDTFTKNVHKTELKFDFDPF